MSHEEGKQHTWVTQGPAGRPRVHILEALPVDEVGREGMMDGSGTFQKSNRRIQVFKKPHR